MKKVMFFLLIAATWASADVKKVGVMTMEFGGTFGKMVKFFGAGKPTNMIDYFTPSRHRSDSFREGKLETTQIIDLNRELFITIDHKDKKYSQMTFDEWRQMMRETMESLKQDEEKEQEKGAEVKWNVTFDVKETGESETIAGLKADKVILTVKMQAEVTEQQEGKVPETSRSTLYAVSNEWLHRGHQKAQQEILAFHMALAKKLGLMPNEASMKNMVRQVFASYPQLAEAMERLQKESKKLEGFPLRIQTVYESEPDRAPQSVKKEETPQIPTSVGGLAGALGKKMLEKQAAKKETSDRIKLMQISEEVSELSTDSLSDDLFQIPQGYKEMKKEK